MAFVYSGVHVAAGSTDNTSVTTAAYDTTGAQLLFIAVGNFSAGSVAPTDSKSNTWTAMTRAVIASFGVQVFYCLNPTVGTGHTFSNSSAATYPAIAVAGFTFGATPALDGTVATNTAASGTLIKPGSRTPTNALELFVTAVSCGNTVSPATIDSSYTVTNIVTFGSGTNDAVAFAYKIQSGSAAAEDPQWTLDGGGSNSAATHVIFAEPTAQQAYPISDISAGGWTGWVA